MVLPGGQEGVVAEAQCWAVLLHDGPAFGGAGDGHRAPVMWVSRPAGAEHPLQQGEDCRQGSTLHLLARGEGYRGIPAS